MDTVAFVKDRGWPGTDSRVYEIRVSNLVAMCVSCWVLLEDGRFSGDVLPDEGLRERPYAGALDVVSDVARRHSVLFATSRERDETDSLRWLHAYGLDATPNWNLDLCRDTYPETFEWTIRDSCRRDGSGIRFCHIWDKTFLDADLTIEDNPHTLDWLMDKGLRVLVKRHAYNLPQCERAERSGLGLSFDDWTQVPALAKRLVKENAK